MSPPTQRNPPKCEANCAHHRPVRLSWARLLKRVFALDLEHCPNCCGELKIIAAAEVPVMQRTRRHRSGQFVQGQLSGADT